MILAISLLLLILSSTAITTSTVTINNTKTTGQLLDDLILQLQQNIQKLIITTHNLQNKYLTTKQEIDAMKEIQELCAPCKTSHEKIGPCDCTDIKPRKDCLAFFQDGYKVNGIYKFQKGPGFRMLYGYCDQTTDGGGWTVFQRRRDGSVDFNKNWEDYKLGFGHLKGEFWYGNQNIHRMTNSSFAPKKSQLLITMRMKGQNSTIYAKYDKFEIRNETSWYSLKIDGFSGNVRNWMKYNNNNNFTTFDSDHDRWQSGNCASDYGDEGGWWYGWCSRSYLNGKYTFTRTPGEISWFIGAIHQPEFVEMKMRKNLL